MKDDAIQVVKSGTSFATGATSTRVAIPTDSEGTKPRYIRVACVQTAFVKLGDSTVTATSDDLMIPALREQLLVVGGATHLAGLQLSAAGVLQISPLEDK